MTKSRRIHAAILVAALGSLGMGCELIAKVDRAEIPPTGAGGAGEGGTAGMGGKGGAGGAGGAACVPEDDNNECTEDVCNADGTTAHNPTQAGSACTMGGTQCDGNGACVECIGPSDCPGQDNECQTRTCEAGVCGFDYAATGTASPTQVAGDCKISVCDGAGALIDQNDDVDVPVDNNTCTGDVCTAGAPSNPVLPLGTNCGTTPGGDPLLCDDAGQCVGCNAATDCPGADDECKARTCVNKVCGVSYTAQGTAVAAQTPNDCLSQVCDGNGAIVASPDDADVPVDDGNACSDEQCAAGLPIHPDKNNGTACNDGDACSMTDMCMAGACTGTNPVSCMALDQCHVAGTCDSATGMCSNPNAMDGTSCADGNACTQTDACQAGTCTGGNPVTCTALDQCHVAGVCDGATGMCSNPDAADGTSCSDGNACTVMDSCQTGACSSGTPVTCMALDQCHVAGVCDTGTGMCSNPNAMDGTACTSGGVNGACGAGACVACGDGQKAATEACDDGNTTNNDGCSSTCAVEPNYTCAGTPSVCILTETEPNSACGTVNGPFVVPFTVTGAITPIADKDIYSFNVPNYADVKIETGAPTMGTCNADTVIQLRGTDCTTILVTDDEDGLNSCSLITPTTDLAARHLPPGKYYAYVERYLNSATIAAYQLQVTFTALCGNGIKEGSEECDTSGPSATCDAACERVPVCGDGLIDGTEECDTSGPSATCDAMCQRIPLCGDGFIDGTETCDDGNTVSGDCCTSACILEPGCQIETEPNSTCAAANGPFSVPFVYSAGITPAGDLDYFSFVVPAIADVKIETFVPSVGTCPTGNDTLVELRAPDCTTVLVTDDDDGINSCSMISSVDVAATKLAPGTYYVRTNEYLNDGVLTNYQVQVTFTALCGNGIKEGSEECDGGAGCTANCTFIAVCGDFITSAGEQCDDGNTTAADGCSATCQWETTAEVNPNGTTAEADVALPAISANANITGAINPTLDLDLYKVVVPALSVVRFETFDPSGRDCTAAAIPQAMKLTLLDSAGVQLKQDLVSAGIGLCSELTTLLGAGTYYIRAEKTTAGTIPAYFLQVRFQAPNGSEIEPNDTQPTATPMPGRDVYSLGDHTVSTDTDWYQLTLPAQMSLRIETIEGDLPSGPAPYNETCESNGIDSTIELLNSAGVSLGTDIDAGRGYCSQIDGTGATPSNAYAKNLAAGTYYIKVTSDTTSATAGNQFKYNLSVVAR